MKNSIYLGDELQDYLDKQVKCYGMGKSAYISMVLATYRQQCDALAQISNVELLLSQLQELVKK